MTAVVGIALIAVISVGVLFMINGVGLFARSKRPRPQDDPEVLTGLIARTAQSEIAKDTLDFATAI